MLFHLDGPIKIQAISHGVLKYSSKKEREREKEKEKEREREGEKKKER
jgi:hypothetical protein